MQLFYTFIAIKIALIISFIPCIAVGCGGLIRRESGQFQSPGYPTAYPHNAECLWNIEVPTGKGIELTLEDTDIENHPDCTFDIIEVIQTLYIVNNYRDEQHIS